jgi:hypothetical protein
MRRTSIFSEHDSGVCECAGEETIVPIDAILSNVAVPIKSCYIIKGEITDITVFDRKPSLPSKAEIASAIQIIPSLPDEGSYCSIRVVDGSGTIDIITPPITVSEEEVFEGKYFLVYEYMTDEGKSLFLLGWARANPQKE